MVIICMNKWRNVGINTARCWSYTLYIATASTQVYAGQGHHCIFMKIVNAINMKLK